MCDYVPMSSFSSDEEDYVDVDFSMECIPHIFAFGVDAVVTSVWGSEETKEQPLFSAEAQVYQLDVKSRRGQWTELSSRPIAVHFYNDIVRGTYRVLCVDGSKPLINCSLTTSIVLKKTSGKFAQWLDPRTKTLYGFGFSNDIEMDVFVTKFKDLQSKIGGPRVGQRPVPSVCDSSDITPDISCIGGTAPPGGVPADSPLLLMQLEQLKGALAESSQAAKHWEVELQNLNKQNVDLKATLDAMMLMHKGNRCPITHTDSGATAAYIGDSVQLVADHVQGYPHPQPIAPFERPRHRSLADELMGNGGPSVISEQLQSIFDEHKAVQPRLHSYESGHGRDNENRQLILQLQKAIGEKLTEVLALHKMLTRLL